MRYREGVEPDHDMEVVFVASGERVTNRLITRSVVVLAEGSEFEDCELYGCDVIHTDGTPIFASDGQEHKGDPKAMQSCPPDVRKLLMAAVRARGAIKYLAGHPEYDPFLTRV